MSQQLVIWLPDELVEALEDLVSRGSYVSKAEAIRSAIRRVVDEDRRRRVGGLIAQGYASRPQAADDEIAGVTEATAVRALRALDAEDAGAQDW